MNLSSNGNNKKSVAQEILVEQKTEDCLVDSKTYIKTEPDQDEGEYSIIAGTSSDMCSDDNERLEMYEPIVKIELENPEDEVLLNPLIGRKEIEDKKDEIGHIISVSDRETSNKTGGTEEEEDETNAAEKDELESTSSVNFLFPIGKEKETNRHICDLCHKSFLKKGGLDNHYRIHTGEKPFTCNICHKSFSRQFILQDHSLTHTKKRPHTCEICNRSFSRKQHLKGHMLVHTGEKPFSCNQCGELFAHRQNLVQHERIHTGEKPYNCEVCHKAFSRKSVLNRHRIIHTGIKPYTCEVCTKSFSDKANFVRHKKLHQ